jgi:hypothetical protein
MAGVRRTPKQVSWHKRLLASHIGSRIFISEDINRLSEAAGLPGPSKDRHPQLLASLNRALFDAHSQSDVERILKQPAAGELIESFDDIARNAHQLLMALGIGSVPSDLVRKPWSEIAEESGIVRAMIHTIPPSCLAEDPLLNQYIAAGSEGLDQSRIAARDRMLVEAVRGVGSLAIAAKACSSVMLPRKDERRGPIPNPLPPAILDQLINVFWEMFDRRPTSKRDLSTGRLEHGPTYRWMREALIITHDRLEPEKMIEPEKMTKHAAPPPMPPWSSAPTAQKPVARNLSSFEKRILSAVNRLLQSKAMDDDLLKAIGRRKDRRRTSSRGKDR